MDQQVEVPNGLAICWNKSTNFLFHSFTKLTKDLDSKIEYNIPFSSQIMLIESSKCNSLIAFGLKNNNLVVLDLLSGLDRCCVHFEGVESIKRIYFLPPAIPANTNLLSSKQSEFKIPTKLICLLSNGDFYIIDCTFGVKENVSKIFASK